MIDRKIGRMVCLAGLCLVVTAPTLAFPESPATGVPDAPGPADRVLARHDGFELTRGFVTSGGTELPEGTYDLELIECAGQYFIRLVNRDTRKGLRVTALTEGDLEADPEGPTAEVEVSIRTEDGKDSLILQQGGFTAALLLRGTS